MTHGCTRHVVAVIWEMAQPLIFRQLLHTDVTDSAPRARLAAAHAA
jgi:hypothetical protein